MAQGDEGDKFYLIRRGGVDVRADRGGARRASWPAWARARSSARRPCLTGEPRNATVIAREETELYTLNKEDFQAVVKASASFEEELRKALFQRQ